MTQSYFFANWFGYYRSRRLGRPCYRQGCRCVATHQPTSKTGERGTPSERNSHMKVAGVRFEASNGSVCSCVLLWEQLRENPGSVPNALRQQGKHLVKWNSICPEKQLWCEHQGLGLFLCFFFFFFLFIRSTNQTDRLDTYRQCALASTVPLSK